MSRCPLCRPAALLVLLFLSGTAAADEARLARLQQSVDALRAILINQVVPLLETEDAESKELSLRLAQLERSLAALAGGDCGTVDPARAAAPRAAAPAASAPTPKPKAQEQGAWGVNLSAYSERPRAEQEQARLLATGVPARIYPVERGGETLYRLRVPGFSSRATAEAYIGQLKVKAGLGNAYPSTE